MLKLTTTHLVYETQRTRNNAQSVREDLKRTQARWFLHGGAHDDHDDHDDHSDDDTVVHTTTATTTTTTTAVGEDWRRPRRRPRRRRPRRRPRQRLETKTTTGDKGDTDVCNEEAGKRR